MSQEIADFLARLGLDGHADNVRRCPTCNQLRLDMTVGKLLNVDELECIYFGENEDCRRCWIENDGDENGSRQMVGVSALELAGDSDTAPTAAPTSTAPEVT